MIVSHQHQFIFVKTRKTAGTSVELALSRVLTHPSDIITPVSPEDEVLRPAGSPPRNFAVLAPPWRWRRRQLRQLRSGRVPTRMRFQNHLGAEQIRSELPDEWTSYTKVGFVRNPWDVAVSRYFYLRHQHGSTMTLDQYIDATDHADNWRSITIDGRVALDAVYRFEHLKADVGRMFADHLGIAFDGDLPRSKSNTGRDGRHYREVLTDQHAARIADVCADEISEFGYTF